MIEFTISVRIFGATKIVRFMKVVIFLIFIVLGMQNLFAQEDKKSENIYDPARNAQMDSDSAVKMAKNNGKNVLIQVDGNWCLCIHKFINSDVEIKYILQEGYMLRKDS